MENGLIRDRGTMLGRIARCTWLSLGSRSELDTMPANRQVHVVGH